MKYKLCALRGAGLSRLPLHNALQIKWVHRSIFRGRSTEVQQKVASQISTRRVLEDGKERLLREMKVELTNYLCSESPRSRRGSQTLERDTQTANNRSNGETTYARYPISVDYCLCRKVYSLAVNAPRSP